MHERSLPASPNWYCSRCSDVSSSGRLLGVGAKNTIFLIDISASSCRVVGESARSGVNALLFAPESRWSQRCWLQRLVTCTSQESLEMRSSLLSVNASDLAHSILLCVQLFITHRRCSVTDTETSLRSTTASKSKCWLHLLRSPSFCLLQTRGRSNKALLSAGCYKPVVLRLSLSWPPLEEDTFSCPTPWQNSDKVRLFITLLKQCFKTKQNIPLTCFNNFCRTNNF